MRKHAPRIGHQCRECGRNFKTQAAMQQHISDVHGFQCDECARVFKTNAALSQHFDAIHSKSECDFCGEAIEDAAMKQHEIDVHGVYIHIEDAKIHAPVPGKWVYRMWWRGVKGFGYFYCPCGKYWISAHAFPAYRQGCKKCERKSLPAFMWVCSQQRDRDDDDSEDKREDKPHDSARCEACKAGVCKDNRLLSYKGARYPAYLD